jgi:hypothetical protein
MTCGARNATRGRLGIRPTIRLSYEFTLGRYHAQDFSGHSWLGLLPDSREREKCLRNRRFDTNTVSAQAIQKV